MKALKMALGTFAAVYAAGQGINLLIFLLTYTGDGGSLFLARVLAQLTASIVALVVCVLCFRSVLRVPGETA